MTHQNLRESSVSTAKGFSDFLTETFGYTIIADDYKHYGYLRFFKQWCNISNNDATKTYVRVLSVPSKVFQTSSLKLLVIPLLLMITNTMGNWYLQEK